jgi:hypothetical protein
MDFNAANEHIVFRPGNLAAFGVSDSRIWSFGRSGFTNKLRFTFTEELTNGNVSVTELEGTVDVPPNTWTHVAVTYR